MKKKEILTVFSLLIVSLAALVAGGCTRTFIVHKGDKTYFFGKNKEGYYKLLCESGDLKAVFSDAQLPAKIKDDLYKYNCVVGEQSQEKIAEIYSSMTPDQRRALHVAFNNHGYDINLLQC